jgi:sulfide dehydrogenase [flavocytochrome c] flavoprotein chain
VFTGAWQSLYPGLIEWVASTADGSVLRVDTASMTLHTANAAHRVAVANVIPPQAPGQIAADAGLASDHGWCPIAPRSFESALLRDVHVIGDACIADAMPKSASAAVSQARQCASAIVALLAGREVPEPAFDSICYSMVAPDSALSIPARFAVQEDRITALELPATSSDANSSASSGAQQAHAAQRWYEEIRAEAFGG